MKSNVDFSRNCSLDDLPVALKVPEVAQVLNIGISSVYNLIHSGQLRHLRIGRKIRVPKSAIRDYLETSA